MNMAENGQYSILTGNIIGCAIEVHKELGCGFQEVIYQRAMEIEMNRSGLNFIREFEMDIFYKDQKVGNRRVDFLVDHKVIVELKAMSQLESVHFAQAINYLEAYQLEVGLLLNFGSSKLEIKRLINSKIKRDP
jgi:GxxExxY protein